MKVNLDEYFCPVPGSDKENEIILFVRRHWASFLDEILIASAVVFIPATIIVLGYIIEPSFFHGIFLNFLLIIGSIYYLIIFSFILSLWMSFYYDLYIVTNKLMILKE